MELLSSRRCRVPPKEAGVVLLVTLIVLIVITIGTIAVVRSMDTSNVISGNFAFKQAAMQSSDRAITDALNNLASIAIGTGGNTSQANRYFSTRQTTLDALGVPTAINWTQVQCRDEENNACAPAVDTGKYRIQYYIERQCASNPDLSDIQDIKTNCDYEVRQLSPEQIALRYRVIVRVQGPRNATGMYEVMVSGPATS
jgi:type IV pilus assembly protein PilX